MKLMGNKWVLEQMEIITVGFPFCFFKYLCGLVLWQHGYPIIGCALLVLSALDMLINCINLGWLLFFRKRLSGTCSFNIAADLLSRSHDPMRVDNWRNVGNSLDVLVSFTIVAGVIGLGGLKLLDPDQIDLWNISVVLNVIGAGLGRMTESLLCLRTSDRS